MTQTAEAPALAVNGTEIPPDAIAAEAQNHPAKNPEEAWSEAARALAIKTLLLAEADRLSIEPPLIDDENGRKLLPDDARIEALLEQEVEIPTADEATCRRYYEQNITQFSSPDLVEASHILFAAPQDDKKRYTKAELNAVDTIAELKEHPERFEALAETLSACSSAKQGGNLGQIGPGQTVDEFETFLFNLEAGQMCPVPVKTRFGVHVIKAGRKLDGETLPFEAVQSKIADYLEESTWRRAVAQYLRILVGRAEICGLDIEGSEGLLVQ
ncbi:peptidylprolyl isomerase [Parasphingorhabdus halotolerans]|uniref:Parvulin-like PPIase n=1 Tax=Parasphingorhabdus halotolerans TaxID=2725558 RepID=A0A6H2DPP0_9SPHN|nr:peptidylprolyl isomerase [Parasphingorhabdus halotolerans]QJB70304.1 peptidylprolyl isomerase [Parasphingorhabdus halotolerans]